MGKWLFDWKGPPGMGGMDGRVFAAVLRRAWSGRERGVARHGRIHDRSQCEQVDACVQLPESAPGDKYVGEADGVPLVQGGAHARVLGCNQSHSLELCQQIPALEDAFPVDVDSPLGLWFP